MSYDDQARNLDTYGDGEDGPEAQGHYKALAAFDNLLASLFYYAPAHRTYTNLEEEDLMTIVEYVFEHFDDPR